MHRDEYVHVRCLECGKPLAQDQSSYNTLWNEIYKEEISKLEDFDSYSTVKKKKAKDLIEAFSKQTALDKLGYKDKCCRQHLLFPAIVSSIDIDNRKISGYTPSQKRVGILDSVRRTEYEGTLPPIWGSPGEKVNVGGEIVPTIYVGADLYVPVLSNVYGTGGLHIETRRAPVGSGKGSAVFTRGQPPTVRAVRATKIKEEPEKEKEIEIAKPPTVKRPSIVVKKGDE